MKINLDESSKIRALISGLYQFDENDLFSQAALAVTDDELFIYDDHSPTDKNGGEFHYIIKERYKIDDVNAALDEQLMRNRQFKHLGRLNFVVGEDEDEVLFYYFLNDKKEVQEFIKELKAVGLKVKKFKVDLSPNNL